MVWTPRIRPSRSRVTTQPPVFRLPCGSLSGQCSRNSTRGSPPRGESRGLLWHSPAIAPPRPGGPCSGRAGRGCRRTSGGPGRRRARTRRRLEQTRAGGTPTCEPDDRPVLRRTTRNWLRRRLSSQRESRHRSRPRLRSSSPAPGRSRTGRRRPAALARWGDVGPRPAGLPRRTQSRPVALVPPQPATTRMRAVPRARSMAELSRRAVTFVTRASAHPAVFEELARFLDADLPDPQDVLVGKGVEAAVLPVARELAHRHRSRGKRLR
jgi:hypothetical protein